MPECKECKRKQEQIDFRDKRIEDFENLVRRMSESTDRLLKKGEETKEKVKTAAQ